MNKKILLPIILISILILPSAFALNFDWMFGTFNLITGKIVEETEPTLLNEQVKCSFIGSSSTQNCHTDNGQFECSGTTECSSDVSGESGKSLNWKSSCDGESSTTINGNNKEVVFKCVAPSLTPVSTTPIIEPAIGQINEQVKCNFLNSNTYQKCYSSDWKFSCSGIGSCSISISGAQGAVLTWKSGCSGEISTIIDGQNNELSFECPQSTSITPVSPSVTPGLVSTTPTGTPVPTTTQTCIDSDGFDYLVQGKACVDANCEADRCEGSTILEYICDGNFPRVGFTYSCPNGCSNGACIKGEGISEQITCKFVNSDKEQQCYFSGSSGAVVNRKNFCSGKDSCVVNYNGYKGEQVSWKSSCGGYGDTVVDGQNKEVKFECKTGETNFDTIKNKGFQFAYWQCYDGTETKTADSGDSMPCKSSETWQEVATDSCKDKCYSDNSKCGVNSFSVSGECYAEGMAVIPAFSTSPSTPIKVPGIKRDMIYYMRSDDCQDCPKMDHEVDLLKQKDFFNTPDGFNILINEPGIADKFEIKVFPTLVLYKYACSFKKEGFMTSDEIIAWAYAAKCGEVTEVPTEKIIEPILVCKDSCPSEGKCYPFGYRKANKFCSDM